MSRTAYVYILASKKKGTLYTGVTSNLERRLYEHKHHLLEGFTSKYNVTQLVWFLQGEDITAAIELEKKIKNRGRQWKIDLIEKTNPNWDDLTAEWLDSATPLRSARNDLEEKAGAMTSGPSGRPKPVIRVPAAEDRSPEAPNR